METNNATVAGAEVKGYITEVDAALEKDRSDTAQKLMDRVRKFQEKEGRLGNLPLILRWMGGVVVITAALTFMVQQWNDLDHIMRYFTFLGFTAVLSASGFFCGLKISEDKGARTLLALAAAIVPVHFCQLGGLLFSQSGFLRHDPSYYADAFLWTAPSLSHALGTTAIGVLALIPITLVAFVALVRPEAKRLSLAYLLGNAALLIPTRDPSYIALIALAVFLGTVILDSRYLQRIPAMRTKEGTISRIMLAVPFLVIVGRSLHLYELSYLFISMLFAAAAIMLFAFLPRYLESTGSKAAAQLNSIPFAAISWFVFINDMVVTHGVANDYLIPLFGLPFAALLTVMSLFAIENGKLYRDFAALVVIASTFLELCIFPGIFASIVCIATAILTVSYGYTTEQKFVFFSGVFGLVSGLTYHLRYAADIYSYSPWMSLAAIGIITVVASSYIERNHRSLVAKMESLRLSMKSWN